MNLTPWEDDKVVTPWDSDPIAPQLRLVNPDAPWESDPEPATWWKTIKAIPKTTLGSTQQAIGGITQAVGDVTGVDSVAEVGAGVAESGSRNIEEVHPGEMEFWQRAVLSGASSAAQQVPLIAATVATGGLAAPLTGMAALAGGSTYAESRKKGSDISSSLGHAGIDAATEALFELIPLRFIKDAAAGPVLKLITGTLVREVPTEVATTAIQSVNARLRDKELTGQPIDWKEYGQDLLDTIGSTMVAAPMIGGAAGAIGRMGRRVETGTITPDNPPQQFDQPTIPADSTLKAAAEAAASLIDVAAITEEDVVKAQEVVRKYEESKKSPPNAQAEVVWMPLQLAPESTEIGEPDFFASDKKAANAPNYPNPNTGDRLDRPIMFSTDPAAIGLTPRQVMPVAGTYTLGEASQDRGEDFLKANHDTIEQWRQKYIPDSTFILSNEGLFSGTALGWHSQLAPKMHMIIPAVLRMPKLGLDEFNKNDQAGAFFTLSHEFTHALINDKLYGNMPEEIANQIREISKKSVVPEALLTNLNVEEQALIKEFNAIKGRILNSSMSAQEFLENWLNPAKLGRSKTIFKNLGVAPTDNAMALVKAMARKARASKVKTPELPSSVLTQAIDSFLSLDEYIAEQMPRHLYDTKEDQKTPLGKFFKGALDSLRQFFAGLKGKDGMPTVVKPGTAFSEWLESLSRSGKVIEKKETVVLARNKGKIPAKKIVVEAAKKSVAKAKPKVQKVQHNVETDTDEAKSMMGRKLVADLIRSKAIEIGSADQKELLALIRQKDWSEFKDVMQRHGKKLVKFELKDIPEEDRKVLEPLSVLRAGISEELVNDPKIRAEAVKEWEEKQFRSSFFKAYFGDWENDAAGSSKIRRGAYSNLADPALAKQEEFSFAKEPLAVYHATRYKAYTSADPQGFSEFSKGDLGFHFGTVEAAHTRIIRDVPYGDVDDINLPSILKAWERRASLSEDDYEKFPSTTAGSYLIPAVLNLRNPLYFGREDASMWSSPIVMLQQLAMRNFITQEELADGLDKTGSIFEQAKQETLYPERYKIFEAVRQLLLSKGFDGLVYENNVEGGTTYVAFVPNQVKSLLGAKTFSRSDNFNLELDIDASQPDQLGAKKLLNGVKNFINDLPRFRRAMRTVTNSIYHLVQLQQLAHLNPDSAPLAYMNDSRGKYNRYISSLQAQADHILGIWKDLGDENFSKVEKFLRAEVESRQLWFDLTNKRVLRENKEILWWEYAPNATTTLQAQKFGLDEETTSLVLEIKNVLLSQLNEAEIALHGLLLKRYVNNPDVYAQSTKPVSRHIHEIRQSPFFPEGRFGNRILIIEKKKAVGTGYDIVWREHFEDPIKWEEAWKKAVAKKAPDERIRKEGISDQSYVLMALPTDFVDMAASELGLSDEQLEILMNILQPVKKDKVLGAYDQQRLGIKGYSTDTMRSFANFTWHNANLLAKLIYRSEFNSAIRAVGVELREQKYLDTPESLAQVDKLEHIKSYMEKTRDYVMAPPNEAQTLRAAVSIGYLGFNPKVALLNTFGLVFTWSDITTRFGQVEGDKILVKATRDALRSVKLTDLNTRNKGDYLAPESQKALDQAIKEGVLVQSYAYHLAGMASAGTLYRLPTRQLARKIGRGTIDAAMYAFRLTELSIRRITFLAEFAATAKEPNLKILGLPLSFEERYQLAVSRTNKLQNDYNLGNRVPFMRGVKVGKENPLGKFFEPLIPLATVFMSFAQLAAFHSYGGYELGERRAAKLLGETPRSIWGGYTMKIWIVILLLAGYEGLPGAENILDLAEALWRKFGGAKSMRQELREVIQEIEENVGIGIGPDSYARGFGHNIAGFDVSRSIGFGRIVPGTDALAHPRGSMAEQLGVLSLDLAGPTGGFIKFGLEAIFSDKPRSEVFERLPGGAGNIYTAYQWSQKGVLAPSRAMVTRDAETGQIRDLTSSEIFGKALGFNPEIVSRSRALRFEQYDRQIYYQTRRSLLIEDLFRARDQKDKKAEADVKKAIAEYNIDIPAEYKALRLTGGDIMTSLQKRQKDKKFDEAGLPRSRKYRGLYEDIKESHD